MSIEAEMVFSDQSGHVHVLESAPVLRRLHDTERESLVNEMTLRHYEKGEAVWLPWSDASLCIVASGSVDLSLASFATGRQFVVGRYSPGEIFSWEPGLADNEISPIIESVRPDTELYVVASGTLLRVIAANSHAMIELVDAFLDQCRRQQQNISELAFCTMEVRLARKLADLATSEPQGTVWATRAELANMVYARENKVTEELHRFRSLELIEFGDHQPRKIVVPNIETLLHYAMVRRHGARPVSGHGHNVHTGMDQEMTDASTTCRGRG